MKSTPWRAVVARGGIAIASLLSASAVHASAPDAWDSGRGFAIGIAVHANTIGASDPDPSRPSEQLYIDEAGRGLVLKLGYGFTDAVALRLSLAADRHATTQSGVEGVYATQLLAGEYRFLPGQRARPYVFGGLGRAGFTVDAGGYESRLRGGVAALGLGVLYHLTPQLQLDASGRLDFINWEDVELTRDSGDGHRLNLQAPVEKDGRAAGFAIGLAWQF